MDHKFRPKIASAYNPTVYIPQTYVQIHLLSLTCQVKALVKKDHELITDFNVIQKKVTEIWCQAKTTKI